MNSFFTSINTRNSAGLISTLNSAYAQLATETDRISLFVLSEQIRGAEASLTVIANELFLSTATATQAATATTASTSTQSTSAAEASKSENTGSSVPTVEADILSKIAATNIEGAQNAIFNASINLNELLWEQNLYDTYINKGANIFLMIAFIVAFLGHLGMMIPLRYWYFSVALFLGSGIEFAGYAGRVRAVGDYSNVDAFLLQFICLTLAPAFVAGGIYYLIGYLCLVYGPHFSPLRPRWYSYIFITCDVFSLVIQALGGGIAATALQQHKSSETGTSIMIAGIGFQVASMTLFIVLYLWFLHSVHFKLPEKLYAPTIKNWWTVVIMNLKIDQLDHLWDPKNSHIRRKKLFKYNQLVILGSILFVYIRCIYRVVELAQGWTGFLITHEEYVLTLDGMMILLSVFLLLIMHPYFLFGKKALVLFSIGKKSSEKNKVESDEERGPQTAEKTFDETNDSLSELDLRVGSAHDDSSKAYPPTTRGSL
ncbi:uncharacterized protein KQ657_000565 [Scheffersomyces spartinae]|uniref:Sphingoid long-chain base transporter RSB1 n=1 Tax=Scheffersomyces spartinae TaxID=45513 RepID=A0A9P8AI53_9ASCO|nr:uncharacterized protein KQ657_000565 [Scheffersomyces spartinae]KAG7193498.1 hypothetical protein KQ657_000565 [Scheffersomyces spartinae]